MSTEYYLKLNVCPCCGRAKEGLFVGTSTNGWYFALASYPDENMPKDLADWDRLFSRSNNAVTNEYGDTLSREVMLDIIKNGSSDISPAERFSNDPSSKYISLEAHLELNQAEIGNNNLLMRKINDYCIAHGPDNLPYDLVRPII